MVINKNNMIFGVVLVMDSVKYFFVPIIYDIIVTRDNNT